jgi:hypothetical protein
MRALDAVRGIYSKLASNISAQRQMSDLNFEGFDRWERCGQWPSEDRIARILLIDRNGDGPPYQPPRGYPSST